MTTYSSSSSRTAAATSNYTPLTEPPQVPTGGADPSSVYYTTSTGRTSATLGSSAHSNSSSSRYCSTSQPQCIPTTSLKVSLPPDEVLHHTGPSPPGIQAQQSSLGYGSIPHLEASPRRYRQKESSFDYQYESGTTLGIPTFSDPNQVSPEFLQQQQQQKQQQQQGFDAPPKLPERPSKTSSASPPPLPPKKPLSQQNSWKSNVMPLAAGGGSSSSTRDGGDIYDFLPDPTIGSDLNMSHEETRECISSILQHSQVSSEHVMLPTGPVMHGSPRQQQQQQQQCLVTLEELSRMSVMELNHRMSKGQLPPEVKGMSIMELFDYVSWSMKNKAAAKELQLQQSGADQQQGVVGHQLHPEQQQPQQQPPQLMMKPSFSDNFVSDLPSSTTQPQLPHPADTTSSPSSSISSQRNNPNHRAVREQDSINSLSPGPPTVTRARNFDFNETVSTPIKMFPPAAHPHHQGPPPLPERSGATQLTTVINPPPPPKISSPKSGFEDDFSKVINSAAAEAPEEQEEDGDTSKKSVDRYAVLRELQLEDQLIRAWKTPSEEEKEKEEEEGEEEGGSPVPACVTDDDQLSRDDDDEEDEDEDGSSSDICPDNPPLAPIELLEESEEAQTEEGLNSNTGASGVIATAEEELEEREGEYFKPRVCSSEGSPCSRSESESGSRKSVSEDQASLDDTENKECGEMEEEEEEGEGGSVLSRDQKRDSQIPLYNPEVSSLNLSRNGSIRSDNRNENEGAVDQQLQLPSKQEQQQPALLLPDYVDPVTLPAAESQSHSTATTVLNNNHNHNNNDSSNNTFEATFEANFDTTNELPVFSNNQATGWATFEDGEGGGCPADSLVLSREPSMDQGAKFSPARGIRGHMIAPTSRGFGNDPHNSGGSGRQSVEGFESDWEVQQYSERQSRTRQFTAKENGAEELSGSWWGSSGGGATEATRRNPDHRATASSRQHRIRNSSAASSSKDSQENPFSHDTFTPPVGGVPGHIGLGGGVSTSGTPTILEDDFDQDGILGEEANAFRIHAKVLESSDDSGLTKSDSVNIFSVKTDPFEDDFFVA